LQDRNAQIRGKHTRSEVATATRSAKKLVSAHRIGVEGVGLGQDSGRPGELLLEELERRGVSGGSNVDVAVA
jgi:hypothetical protein